MSKIEKNVKQDLLFEKLQVYAGSMLLTIRFFPIKHPKARFEKVDAKVIDAHIVPDNVLFLGPTAEGEQFKTLAFTDMLRVDVYISKSEDGEKTRCKTRYDVNILKNKNFFLKF